jgi:tetratricopeptide (TPR) repeat protein
VYATDLVVPVCMLIAVLGSAEATAPQGELMEAEGLRQKSEVGEATALSRTGLADGRDSAAAALLRAARMCIRNRDWDGAVEELDAAVRQFPSSAESMAALSIIYAVIEQWKGAKEAEAAVWALVQDVLAPAGCGAQAIDAVASIYVSRREYRKAAECAKRVMVEYPAAGDVETAVHRLSIVYQLWRGVDDALAEMRRVIAGHPKEPAAALAQYEVAALLKQKKECDAAAEAYRDLVRTYPESPLALRAQGELGALYFEQKKYDEAIAEYEKALSISGTPDLRAQALRALGVAHFMKREYDQAVRRYQCIQRMPDLDSHRYADARYLIAFCYMVKGDYAKAITCYEEIIDKDGSNDDVGARAYLNIGLMRLRQGDKARARAAFQEILEAYPRSPTTRAARSQLERMQDTRGSQGHRDP